MVKWTLTTIYFYVSFDEMMDRRNAGAYRARVYLLSGVASPELNAVAEEFGISMTSVSKMQGEIERMDEIDIRS